MMVVGLAVAVAIAIVAPPLGAALGAAIGISTAVATALVTIGLSLAVSFAFRALGVGVPMAKNQVGPPNVFRQSIANSFIVYGKRRVGGLMVFFHSLQSTSGAHFRYFVIACAGHRCNGLVSWMLNDEIVTVDGSNMVTSGKYRNNAWLWFVRGTDTDVANATFVSECGGKWTTAHKGLGVAKIYAKFKLEDGVDEAGMPNITAIIEGKDDILDTRDASVGYTANGPLVFYDWLKLPREEGGFGAYDDEIPDDSWINAQANVADEVVSSEPRYEINAVMTTGSAPSEVRDALVVNMAGTYTFSGGKHLMRPGYWVPPSVTLEEDDLAGAITVSPMLAGDVVANEVQGTYISTATHYQGAPFTTQSLASPPTDLRQLDLDLAFTTSLKQANRVARIMLNRAQCEKTVTWPMNIEGLKVRALDTVQVDKTDYSLNNYAFQVSNWGLSADYGVVVNLREENEDIYGAPTPVTPVTPPVVDEPTTPVLSSTEIQAILRTTYPRGLTITSTDAGSSAPAAPAPAMVIACPT